MIRVVVLFDDRSAHHIIDINWCPINFYVRE